MIYTTTLYDSEDNELEVDVDFEIDSEGIVEFTAICLANSEVELTTAQEKQFINWRDLEHACYEYGYERHISAMVDRAVERAKDEGFPC